MNKKNLITCGCSFTEGHKLSLEETWGGYVANKQNYILHNIASGGQGNEWITQKTIGYLENNKELKSNSIVMIAWSEPGRLMGTFQSEFDGPVELVTIRPDDFIDDGMKKHWTRDTKQYHGYALTHGKVMSPFFSSYSFCFAKTYQAMFNLKTYLEYNNIPYVFFDALADNKLVSFEQVSSNSYYKLVCKDSYGNDVSIKECVPWGCENYLNSDFVNQIYDNKFIRFNGNSLLLEMRLTKYNYYTEGNEGHPNVRACDYFSDLIIKEYNKLYN